MPKKIKTKGVSTGVEKDKEAETHTDDIRLTEEQLEQRGRILKRADRARDNREDSHHYFDEMTYLQDYKANEDAANTYLTPKINQTDIRINTATSEKKLDTIINQVLSMNIQPEVRAHDIYDNEIKYLGKDIEDIVIRTNRIEKEEDVIEDAVRELITQRALFMKEVFVERTVVDKRSRNNKYTIKRTEKRLIPGRKIYLGDMSIPAYRFNEQPFVIEYDKTNWDMTHAMFSDNENWEFVRKGSKLNITLEYDSQGYAEWLMNDIEDDQVEIVRYYSYPDDEYQVYVNGIPMKDVDAALPWEWEGYNISMTVVKSTAGDWAYGKPPIASAKTLQALENETIRNFVFKMRQGLQPPLGTQGKKIFGKQIWDPGAMTQGVSKGTFEKLIDHSGVTQADMAMFQLINSITEEFTGVSRSAQGLDSPGEKTATQAVKDLEQSLKMMGQIIAAVLRMRISVTYLRVYNILENHTKALGRKIDPLTKKTVNKYMNFTISDTDLGSGVRGTKKIIFQDRDLTERENEDIFEEEEREKKRGRNVRFRSLNIKKLRNFPLVFYVTALEKERPGSAVDKLMQTEKINQVATIEKLSQGQVRGNWAGLAEDVSAAWSSRDLFQKAPPEQLPGAEGEENPELDKVEEGLNELEGASSQTGFGAQMTEGVRNSARLPTAAQATRQPV